MVRPHEMNLMGRLHESCITFLFSLLRILSKYLMEVRTEAAVTSLTFDFIEYCRI